MRNEELLMLGNTSRSSESNTKCRITQFEKKEIIHFELDGDFGCCYILEGVLMVDHHLEIIT